MDFQNKLFGSIPWTVVTLMQLRQPNKYGKLFSQWKGAQDHNSTIKKCKNIYCLPLLETRSNVSEAGQSIAVESVVPATALIVKLSWLRLQSIIMRPSAV